MMVRLDFSGRAKKAARAMRVARTPSPGLSLIADAGPHLPFRNESVDEIFAGRSIARRADFAETLDEFWRVSKPGTLVHLTLPHASSIIAASRDPHSRPLLTLNTFNYYNPAARTGGTAFAIERARLRVAGERASDSGLALARGPFAQFIEKLANKSRGSQYRFERWFAGLIGGFEEFDVVLSVVKPAYRGNQPSFRNPPAFLDTGESPVDDVVVPNADLPGTPASPIPGEAPRSVPEYP